MKIGMSDTGLQPNLNVHPWMTNVTGDRRTPRDDLAQWPAAHPRYAGHGTFAAGVAKCTAPDAAVFVNNHFTESEGEAEDVIVQKLNQLITDQNPDLVCLPAGLYARNNSQSLPFNQLHQSTPTSPWSLLPATTACSQEVLPGCVPMGDRGWRVIDGSATPGVI